MTELIVGFIQFIRDQFIFNLFAEVGLGVELFSNLNTYIPALLDFLAKVNFLIPLRDIFQCLGAVLFVKIGKMTIFVVNWVIRRIFDVIP